MSGFEVIDSDPDDYGTPLRSPKSAQYICPCGSVAFTAHYVPGGFETRIECVKCGLVCTVHVG